MRFIKQNRFLVLLVLAVLVVGGVLVGANSGKSGEADERLKKRAEMDEGLESWERPPFINPKVVEAMRDKNRTIRADAENVENDDIAWNRRNYKVLRLQLFEKATQVGEIDAFPIDREKYGKYKLPLQVTDKYLREMEALRKKLNPIRLPTAAEFDEEVKKQADTLRTRLTEEARQKVAREREKATEAEPVLSQNDLPVRDGRYGPAGPGLEGMTDPTYTPDMSGSEVETRSKKFARDALKDRTSLTGCMYVPERPLGRVFLQAVDEAREERLWMAQVELWVTTDIVEAIVQTVREGFESEKVPVTKRNVRSAWIKRLVKINVGNRYFTSGLDVFLEPGVTEDEPEDRRPVRDYGAPPSAGRTGFPGPGLKFPGGVPGRFSSLAMPTGIEGDKAQNLTGRVTCPDYDLVHYRFTVIMPIEHLFALERNLMLRNLHTILNVRMEEPTYADPEDLHYYGDVPVMEVTFDCEQVMFSAWTRGTEKKAASATSGGGALRTGQIQWQLDPLMPLEALNGLPPSALRDIDNRRLQQSSSPSY